jgi:hypothetical protein
MSFGRDAADDTVARRIADWAWYRQHDFRQGCHRAGITAIARARQWREDFLWSVEAIRQRLAAQSGPPPAESGDRGGQGRMALGAALSLLVGLMLAAGALFGLPALSGSGGDGASPPPVAVADTSGAEAEEPDAPEQRARRTPSGKLAPLAVRPSRAARNAKADTSAQRPARPSGLRPARGHGSGDVAGAKETGTGSPAPSPRRGPSQPVLSRPQPPVQDGPKPGADSPGRIPVANPRPAGGQEQGGGQGPGGGTGPAPAHGAPPPTPAPAPAPTADDDGDSGSGPDDDKGNRDKDKDEWKGDSDSDGGGNGWGRGGRDDDSDSDDSDD